jgi:hypothetical protein
MSLGYKQDMRWRNRIYIAEGEKGFILINLCAWDFPAYNFTENAGHIALSLNFTYNG